MENVVNTKKEVKIIMLEIQQLCWYALLRFGGMLKNSSCLTRRDGDRYQRFYIVLGNVRCDLVARDPLLCYRSAKKESEGREVYCPQHRIAFNEQSAAISQSELSEKEQKWTPEYVENWRQLAVDFRTRGQMQSAEQQLKVLGLQPVVSVFTDVAYLIPDDFVVEWMHTGPQGLAQRLAKGFVLWDRKRTSQNPLGKMRRDEGILKRGEKVEIVGADEGHFRVKKSVGGREITVGKEIVEELCTESDKRLGLVYTRLKELGLCYIRTYPKFDPVSLTDLADESAFRRATVTDLMMLFLPFVLAECINLDVKERDWIIGTFILYNKFFWNWAKGATTFPLSFDF